MAYYFSRKLHLPFNEAIGKITQTLQQQGFDIITTIDLKAALKQKINIDFRNYQILGACHAEFAYNAISLESHIGLMLPCNIVVQEHENGEVEVSAMNPLESIDKSFTTTNMVGIGDEVANRLRVAIDALYHEIPALEHDEVLH